MLTVALMMMTLAAPPVAADTPSIVGAWTMNRDLSDAIPERAGDARGERGEHGDRGGRRGGYGGGRGGRGGFGGGGGRGGGARGEAMSPDDMARMREAMRSLIDPSDHLTIVDAGSMIVITGADGRTTRLSTDGKKIKDENTGIERKTKWDGGKLVSEISGLNRGKATQTFTVDPEKRQLRIVVQMEGGRDSKQPRTITHVYDRDSQ